MSPIFSLLIGFAAALSVSSDEQAPVEPPIQNLDPVSILDFGATPNDQIDDTQAIQRALDGGGKIVVPGGRYLVSTLHLRRDNVVLTGSGSLQKQDGVDGYLLLVTGAYNIVEGITFKAATRRAVFGSENDALRIEGNHNQIHGVQILGSNGNGVRIDGGAYNLITSNIIRDVYQNSVIIANAGADGNQVIANRLIGTKTQNNIFVTADDGSRPTRTRIEGTIIRENFCVDASDTGIESGQNADGTLIANNRVSGSRNPAILLRDGKNVVIRDNVVTDSGTALHAIEHSGIAIVPWYKPSTWLYNATIMNNRIDLPIVRSGIYVGGSGVRVMGNMIIGRSPSAGYGITVAGDASTIAIRGNSIRNTERGIDLNFDGHPYVRKQLSVVGNRTHRVRARLNRYNLTIEQSRIEQPSSD